MKGRMGELGHVFRYGYGMGIGVRSVGIVFSVSL